MHHFTVSKRYKKNNPKTAIILYIIDYLIYASNGLIVEFLFYNQSKTNEKPA
jgi:hypothetical protein